MSVDNKIENLLPKSQRGLTADFGIEIEIEGTNLKEDTSLIWRREEDGSLRGGREYVLNKPVSEDNLRFRLEHLNNLLKTNKSTIRDSDRTGIHIHLNMQQSTFYELLMMSCCYYIIEEALVDLCGENRQGNHFCLRAIDGEYIINQICISLNHPLNIKTLKSENLRYCALNYNSLFKYGSLEFRALKTHKNFIPSVLQISSILKNIKNNSSKNFKEPEDIIMSYSGDGLRELLLKIVGKDHVQTFLDVPDIEVKVKRGMRLSQDICYSFDTTKNKPETFTWGYQRRKNEKENSIADVTFYDLTTIAIPVERE